MDSLYIVMPAYNEEDNIEQVIRDWYPLLDGKSPVSRLVIADSGSTDRTHTILLNLQKEYPQLDILENTGKQHGPKVIALYDYAIKNRIDYVFQTDSDGQTNPMNLKHSGICEPNMMVSLAIGLFGVMAKTVPLWSGLYACC